MGLSKLTIKRLRMVKEAILANPEMYNQRTFDEAGYLGVRKSWCETPACIAGWASFLGAPTERGTIFDISRRAREWLGLDFDQADRLFSDWPGGACGAAWLKPHTIAGAKHGAEMIERFIANGGTW